MLFWYYIQILMWLTIYLARKLPTNKIKTIEFSCFFQFRLLSSKKNSAFSCRHSNVFIFCCFFFVLSRKQYNQNRLHFGNSRENQSFFYSLENLTKWKRLNMRQECRMQHVYDRRFWTFFFMLLIVAHCRNKTIWFRSDKSKINLLSLFLFIL